MDKQLSAALLLVLAGGLFSLYAYSLLPEEIAIHWNVRGDVDGFAGRGFIFFIPVLSLFLVLLLWYIPNIDPRKKHIEKFRGTYNQFIIVMAGFMTYIGVLAAGANLGWIGNISRFLAPAMGLLFYFTGNLLERSRSSLFIGIRTPWTLSSDKVWEKTHKLGGRMFKVFGVLFAIGMLASPEAAMLPLILVLVAGVFWLFLYSYLEWKKERNN